MLIAIDFITNYFNRDLLKGYHTKGKVLLTYLWFLSTKDLVPLGNDSFIKTIFFITWLKVGLL